ncbi:hypothetical protein M5D96_001301 [Drosophila gunungcola]|uniref:Uncharacterized protein n=1 Tax=Drosophila gunungcola TaxID=103775 RepID=A0A9Q0BUG4_9MUSC|nr:hypothetical protein M5D96_001301 [Drosophila gunungcola]
MDGMRQVSRTVATVVLLLLILPRPAKLNIRIDKSAELEKIEHKIEYTMGSMERQSEAGNEIDLEDSNLISKTFANEIGADASALGDELGEEVGQFGEEATKTGIAYGKAAENASSGWQLGRDGNIFGHELGDEGTVLGHEASNSAINFGHEVSQEAKSVIKREIVSKENPSVTCACTCSSNGNVTKIANAAHDVASAAGKVASSVAGAAGNVAGDAANIGKTVGNIAGDAANAASNVAGDAANAAGNIAGDVGNAIGGVENAAGNVAGDIGNAAGNIAGDIGKTAGNIAGNSSTILTIFAIVLTAQNAKAGTLNFGSLMGDVSQVAIAGEKVIYQLENAVASFQSNFVQPTTLNILSDMGNALGDLANANTSPRVKDDYMQSEATNLLGDVLAGVGTDLGDLANATTSL